MIDRSKDGNRKLDEGQGEGHSFQCFTSFPDKP